MRLRFAKMHGLGNDFMIVDLVTQRVADGKPTAKQIRAWSDRRTGIGFDQFLAALPPDDPDMDFRYRIFNADGSEAEQCGNGARCFARFVRSAKLTKKRELLLQTASGPLCTRLLPGGDVQVDMGVPQVAPQTVPFHAHAATAVCQTPAFAIDIGAEALQVTPVSIGNPHAVVFVDDVDAADVDAVGRTLQRHECFPEQVNVGFLEVVDRTFGRLRVYERGVGETRACGSGACAAMVAARLHDRFDEVAKVSLPGGKLKLAWNGLGEVAKLSGAAKLVYHGSIEL